MADELNKLNDLPEIEFLNLDIDEENTGSVRRIEEGFNKLDSNWILGFNATRYRYGKWIITWTFNPITTDGPSNPGGKKQVTQYGVETREIIALQKASSPGDFYIKNVALKPNAAGKGGGLGWRYASSEFNDLVRSFVAQGTKGLISDVKEIAIPEALQNHISSVNKTIAKMKDPKSSLLQFARGQVTSLKDKTPELKRFFKFTDKAFAIGVEVGEVVFAPEARIGYEGAKRVWSKGSNKAISVGKNFGKTTRKNISKKI